MSYQTSVEIGHSYAPDRLVPFSGFENGTAQFLDTPMAESMRSFADFLSRGDTIRVALLDDVAARARRQESEQDSWRHELFIGISEESLRAGTGASVVKRESEFVEPGRQIVEQIRASELPDGMRLSGDGRILISGSGKQKQSVPLVGFRGIDDPTHPSCQVLDLAWMNFRRTLAPQSETVLSIEYWRQQNQVSLIARAGRFALCGKNNSYFVDSRQQVTGVLTW